MGKLDYFKLLSKACLGKLDDTEIDDLCQKYCRENIDKAGYLLSQQFKKTSNDMIAEFLKVYGLKLWKLYFNTIGAKPYSLEIEKILIFSASQEIFEQIGHNFGAEGEKILVTMQKFPEARDENFIKPKVKWYLEHFALSFEALLQLIKQTAEQGVANKPEAVKLLASAVQKLAESPKPNALASVETQLKLLEFAQEKVLVINLLHYFDMENLPDAQVVQRLIKAGDVQYFRELLSHSCVRGQKEAVYKAFPELKAEILLSELGYAAYKQSRLEQQYFKSDEYQKNVQGCRTKWSEKQNPMYEGEAIPLLQICLGLYADEVKTPASRCGWIKKAIVYCRHNPAIDDLAQSVPLLEKLLAEEQRKQV